jgi:hypothetical protein
MNDRKFSAVISPTLPAKRSTQDQKIPHGILPPALRSQAKIVRLNKFNINEINNLLRHHER